MYALVLCFFLGHHQKKVFFYFFKEEIFFHFCSFPFFWSKKSFLFFFIASLISRIWSVHVDILDSRWTTFSKEFSVAFLQHSGIKEKQEDETELEMIIFEKLRNFFLSKEKYLLFDILNNIFFSFFNSLHRHKFKILLCTSTHDTHSYWIIMMSMRKCKE